MLTVFLMFALFSFLAFSIDVGFLAGAKAELRRSADSASLAGCWEVFNQLQNGGNVSTAEASARQTAAQYAAANRVVNSDVTVDTGAVSQKIQVGYLATLSSPASIMQDTSLPFLAVKISLEKNAERNGEVPFFFGKIFGDSGQDMQASATAVMGQRISGFALPPGSSASLPILPFALDQTSWDALTASSGNDNYNFDRSTGQVHSGGDGIREVNLYPQGTGSPGNRGTVDIGSSNNSTADIARQIVNGISPNDLQSLGKPLTIETNGTLTLNGDTGISAGVKDDLASIIGQTRIIPVFSTVSGNGNNASYNIVKWVGVRVLSVKLTGAMSQKHLMVQPAPIIARYAVTGETDGISSGVYTPVTLAR